MSVRRDGAAPVNVNVPTVGVLKIFWTRLDTIPVRVRLPADGVTVIPCTGAIGAQASSPTDGVMLRLNGKGLPAARE